MSNEITVRGRGVALPARTQTLLQEWRESPKKSYDRLPDTISHKEIFDSDSPTLGQIKNNLGEGQALMVISIAIEKVNAMFRQDRRIPPEDVVVIAREILRHYWYLKPEDIKKCLEGRRPKSFVLEGDSFLSMLADYDLQRDRACEDVAVNGNSSGSDAGAIAFETYMAMLESRANDGDEDAQRSLAEFKKRAAVKSDSEKRKEKLDFHKFKMEYLKEKQLKEQKQ